MEIVTFVGVIRVLPRLDSHICDRDRQLCALCQCNHFYLFTRFVSTNIQFTTLNIHLHPVKILPVVSRAVQVSRSQLSLSNLYPYSVRTLLMECLSFSLFDRTHTLYNYIHYLIHSYTLYTITFIICFIHSY